MCVCVNMAQGASARTISVHECASSCTERAYVTLASDFLSFSHVGTEEAAVVFPTDAWHGEKNIDGQPEKCLEK